MGAFLRRFLALFRRRRLDRDLDDELAFHLAMRREEQGRQGVALADADIAARRQFGNVLRVKEDARDAWVLAWLEDVLQDVRFALRGFRRSLTFSLTAVLTLCVGIAGTVTIFSVVNAVLLRPLPFKDSDRVVFVQGATSSRPDRVSLLVPTADLPQLSRESTTLSHFSTLETLSVKLGDLGDDGDAPVALRAWISPAAFELFDQRPLFGRALEPSDARPGAEPVVVLSYRAWQRYLAGAGDVVGRRLTLNGLSHVVIAVMPRGFAFPTPDVEMWSAWTHVPPAGVSVATVTIARLKEGVSLTAATAEINSLFINMHPLFGRSDRPPPLKLVPIKQQIVAPIRTALLVALTAVVFVLLIACTNVTTLLLARAATRQREMAIRTALGAGRIRLGQQVLVESIVLGVLGGAAGASVAFALVRLLPAVGPIYVHRLADVRVDGSFLVAALVTTLSASVLFGCAPALRVMRPKWARTPQKYSGFSASSSPSLGRNRTRAALTVLQVALAVMLLIAAGLLGGSFVHLARFDLGYVPDDVLTFTVQVPPTRHSDSERRTIYAQLFERFAASSGVSSVAVAARLPTQPGGSFGGRLGVPGSAEPVPAQLKPVSHNYFDVLRIPIVDGRRFDDTDRPGPTMAVIVSRRLAAAFPDGQALHQTVQLNGPSGSLPLRVVGVAGDVVANSVEAVVRPDMYVLFDQVPVGPGFQPLSSMSFLVRSDGDPGAIVRTVRNVVRQTDPRLRVEDVRTLDDLLSSSLIQPRTNAVLLGLLALVAVLLTAVGIYGIIAYVVTERTQEVGIRMAVGAEQGDVLALIMGQSALLVVPGIMIGLGGAAALTRYLETMLFGLTPLDIRIFGGVPVLVVAVMLVASYLPARRATRIDPVAALRCE
jgi:putative ABC transport system permease protein